MIKLTQCPQIDPDVLKKLEEFSVQERPRRWKGRAQAVLTFKKEILDQGLKLQSKRCAWCVLPVGEEGRRTAHRDHIAPQARYPAWTFLPGNLVITCEYCNGFAVKGELDTIATLSDAYEDCVFHIVHPYLDDPKEHLAFDSEDDDKKILIKSRSDKGTWTIQKLQLDSTGTTRARAKEHVYHRHMAELSPWDQHLVQQAVLNLGN